MRTKLAFVIASLSILPIITLGQGIEHLHDDYYSYKGLAVTLDVDDLPYFRFKSFMVMTDSTLDYYSAINKGVFVTDTYDERDFSSYEIEKITLDGETRARTRMSVEAKRTISDFLSGGTVYYDNGFWSKRIDLACVCFSVFEIEFVFRELKLESFKAANAHAQDEDEALIEYSTTVYFITDILSLKRVEKIRGIPEPDKGSAFRSHKNGRRYIGEGTGCRPLKFNEDANCYE